MGKTIGDTVRARGPHGKPAYRIVGSTVLPTVGTAQALADGAVFDADVGRHTPVRVGVAFAQAPS